jgi:hypothetical protein
MGVVIAKDESIFLSRGYPYNKATLYVYCDHCGSFDIKTYLDLSKWLLVASPFALAAGVILEFSQSKPVSLWWPVAALVVIVLAFKLFWGDKNYRCRRCGRTTSAKYNTLDYSPGTMTLDVPEEAVEKRCLEYWPDVCDLQEWLKPSPQVET